MNTQCVRFRRLFPALSAVFVALVLAGAGGQAHAATLTVAAGRVSGLPATQVVVPVLVTNFTGVSLIQFSLNWDPAQAGFVGVEQFGLPGMGNANFGTVQAASGTLTVSWDDPNGLSTTVTNGASLFGVRLQILGAAGSTMPITVTGNPTAIEAADENLSPMPVGVVGGMLSVLTPDLPPQITGQPQSLTVAQGGTATFSVTANGSGTLGYQWRFNDAALGGQTGATLTLPNVQPAQAGGYSVVVSNAAGSVTSAVATLTVSIPNRAPVFGTLADQTVAEGALLSFTLVATDSDPGQALTYSLVEAGPAGLGLNPASGLVTWTPGETQGPSTNRLTVRVTDNGSPALSDTRSFLIVVLEVNNAPLISPVANRTLNEGGVLSFVVTATDPDVPANQLTFSLEAGAPAGATIHPQTGEFLWTPGEDMGPSVRTVSVRVTDNGNPPLSQSTTFTITVNEVNSPPVLAAPGNRVVAEGSTLLLNAVATDSDIPVQTLVYTLDAGAPAGASINPLTGAFSWTPTETQGPSTNLITIRVSDNGSPMLSDAKSFLVVVTEVNASPVLAAPGDRLLVEGGTLLVTNVATDADLPAQRLTFSLAPGTPAGVAVDPASGLLTWVTGEADGPSTNTLVLLVSDNGQPALVVTQAFQVVVLESNQPPTLRAIADQTAQVLVPLTITNVVEDPDLPTNHISFQFLEAPKGARMNRLTGVIYWSPARDQARSTNVFTVIAMDNGEPNLQVTNTFLVTVEDFIEVMLGEAVLRAGEAGSVPMQMLSSVGVTNIESQLYMAPDQLSGLSLKGTVPEIGAVDLQQVDASRTRLSLGVVPGQVLASYQPLGRLGFTAIATQSAFVNLTLSGLLARQTNGAPVSRTIAGAGRVVVVAEEPLLEATLQTNAQRQLVLYGPPGAACRIEKTASLGSARWQDAWAGDVTNLVQAIPMAETNGMFYRARRTR